MTAETENKENTRIGIATRIKLDKEFVPDKYPPIYKWDDGKGDVLEFKLRITRSMENYLRKYGILTKEAQSNGRRGITTAKIEGIQIHLKNNVLEWINPPNDGQTVDNYRKIVQNLRNKGYKVVRIGCKPLFSDAVDFDNKYCEEGEDNGNL